MVKCIYTKSIRNKIFFSETADTTFLAAFSVNEFPISDDEVIVFDTAPINQGGCYSTLTGAYTAPYSGYYQ